MMNLAEYEGPVVNVPLPPQCANPIGYMWPCPVCTPSVQYDDTADSAPMRLVELRTVAVWVYRDKPQNVVILAGQCATCGTVCQTWHCKQQEATR
jgi:hypothetical protein